MKSKQLHSGVIINLEHVVSLEAGEDAYLADLIKDREVAVWQVNLVGGLEYAITKREAAEIKAELEVMSAKSK